MIQQFGGQRAANNFGLRNGVDVIGRMDAWPSTPVAMACALLSVVLVVMAVC
jgi:hypothetical protein